MTKTADDASLPTDIPGLERELADMKAQLSDKKREIQALIDAEDPAGGVYHAAAIHEAKQAHMALRYRKEFCQARLTRLRCES